MRIFLTTGAAAAAMAATFVLSPADAQGGGQYMWCQATVSDGTDVSTYYYSAFFAAGAWEAQRKALAFKSEVEDQLISAAAVEASCMDPAEYDMAVATRNAVMKSAPGTVLAWEGQ